MGYTQETAVRDENEYSEQNRVTSLYDIIEEIGDRSGGDNNELIIATTLAFLESGKAMWISLPPHVDLNELSGIAKRSR